MTVLEEGSRRSTSNVIVDSCQWRASVKTLGERKVEKAYIHLVAFSMKKNALKTHHRSLTTTSNKCMVQPKQCRSVTKKHPADQECFHVSCAGWLSLWILETYGTWIDMNSYSWVWHCNRFSRSQLANTWKYDEIRWKIPACEIMSAKDVMFRGRTDATPRTMDSNAGSTIDKLRTWRKDCLLSLRWAAQLQVNVTLYYSMRN